MSELGDCRTFIFSVPRRKKSRPMPLSLSLSLPRRHQTQTKTQTQTKSRNFFLFLRGTFLLGLVLGLFAMTSVSV